MLSLKEINKWKYSDQVLAHARLCLQKKTTDALLLATFEFEDFECQQFIWETKSSYISIIIETHRKIYNEPISSSYSKSSTVWSTVNTLTGRSSGGPSVVLDIDGVSLDNSDELVNMFAEYFSTITESPLDHYYQNTLSTSCITPNPLNSIFFSFRLGV